MLATIDDNELLIERLENIVLSGSTDGAHDLGHFRRVFNTSIWIVHEESLKTTDSRILAAASYLHDFIQFPKNSEFRAHAAKQSAEAVAPLLLELGFTKKQCSIVADAIKSHSFSANLKPTSIEGRIISDADKLDALGIVGFSRLFYVSGQIGSLACHPVDPLALNRQLEPTQYMLDHFFEKIIRLPALMHFKCTKIAATKQLDVMLKLMHDCTLSVTSVKLDQFRRRVSNLLEPIPEPSRDLGTT